MSTPQSTSVSFLIFQIPETAEELQEFIDKTIATLEGVEERLKKSVTPGGKSSR